MKYNKTSRVCSMPFVKPSKAVWMFGEIHVHLFEKHAHVFQKDEHVFEDFF